MLRAVVDTGETPVTLDCLLPHRFLVGDLYFAAGADFLTDATTDALLVTIKMDHILVHIAVQFIVEGLGDP